MERQLTKQEILDKFDESLKNGDIYVVYQAQINHSTGRMVGAEALIRWFDPECGNQYPSDFIPVLEEGDLILKLDLSVFEDVCRLQRLCLDNQYYPVPISVNMSRYDICNNNDYVSRIEEIRQKYQIPVEYLRIEITEGSAIGGTQLITSVLNNLHKIGYIVEMDDFGSGYSSLNILKDLDVDVIKFDMEFLKGEIGGRGGAIINSMMQMAKWLDTPVIAEGVETLEQADFMRSIGCYYIQGYLYTKPIKKEEFIKKSQETEHEPLVEKTKLFEDIDTGKFWNPDSIETLLFNNFVGPAAIFTYEKGNSEILRVNQKYVKELGMNTTEKSILEASAWEGFDQDNRRIYEATILKAIESHAEEECETWRSSYSDCCGQDRVCIRSFIRIIGRVEDQYLVYASIRNITAEKEAYEKLAENEKKFRVAGDQSNTFAWEYTIATKEMRPCSRCMRILGFPPLLRDYPEPAIADGTFPPEFADEYREWHRKLAEGAESFEAIVPLTKDRVPFHIRYTAEFDENGRPFKAYGSAVQVVD